MRRAALKRQKEDCLEMKLRMRNWSAAHVFCRLCSLRTSSSPESLSSPRSQGLKVQTFLGFSDWVAPGI